MIDIYELLRRDQNGTSEYVQEKLLELDINFEMDEYGNIFSFENGEAPLLSAHMDTVRKNADKCIGAFLTEDKSNDKIISGGILGGDDKCGVYIILKVLEAGKKINFVFSRDEEIGCIGIGKLANSEENQNLMKKCLYALILDRRGNSDIICNQNDYGTKEFEAALKVISDKHKFDYKPERGLYSDANTICKYVSSANLSVGYFSPHKTGEYIVKKDLEKATDYVFAIIDELKEHFDPLEKKSYYNYTSKTTEYYNNKSKNDRNYYGYYNYYDDYYDYDYYAFGYNYKDNKDNDKKYELCDFCDFDSGQNEPTHEIIMPDGVAFHICEWCLKDLETSVKETRKKFEEDEKGFLDK